MSSGSGVKLSEHLKSARADFERRLNVVVRFAERGRQNHREMLSDLSRPGQMSRGDAEHLRDAPYLCQLTIPAIDPPKSLYGERISAPRPVVVLFGASTPEEAFASATRFMRSWVGERMRQLQLHATYLDSLQEILLGWERQNVHPSARTGESEDRNRSEER